MRLLSGKRVFFCAERQSYANILIRDNYNFLGGPLAPLGSHFSGVPCSLRSHRLRRPSNCYRKWQKLVVITTH